MLNRLIYSNHRLVRFLRHMIFWAADMFNWLMVISIGRDVTSRDVSFFLATVPVAMAATYFVLYVLLPRFTNEDKGKIFVYIVLVLFAMGTVLRIYKFYVVIPLVGWDPIPANDLWSLGGIISEIFKWMAVITMAVAIKLIKNKNELQQKNDQLLLEKKAAELSFLKLQMNPHFLFNTLNTLYSETIQETNKGGEVVMHLSNLMRFILEECHKPLISLQSEIKVIKDYIELEKLRHGARLKIDLSLPEQKSNPSLSPLLFLPFVENAFKHSLNHVRGPIAIDIKINITETNITLVVENDQDKNGKGNGYSSGLGIANVRRQLDLLYPASHSLKISDSGSKYRVELTIPTQN